MEKFKCSNTYFSLHREILDVEGNCISDMSELDHLATCPQLRELSIACNPICKNEDYSLSKVRQVLTNIHRINSSGISISMINGTPC